VQSEVIQGASELVESETVLSLEYRHRGLWQSSPSATGRSHSCVVLTLHGRIRHVIRDHQRK